MWAVGTCPSVEPRASAAPVAHWLQLPLLEALGQISPPLLTTNWQELLADGVGAEVMRLTDGSIWGKEVGFCVVGASNVISDTFDA